MCLMQENFKGECNTMTRALIIVDVQNSFVSGTLAVPGGERVANAIHNLLATHFEKLEAAAVRNYDLVVTTQDWHVDPGDHWSDNPDYVDTWPVHCEAQTWGAELHEAVTDALEFVTAPKVNVRKGEFVAAYSGFEGKTNRNQTLESVLTDYGVDEVDICGLATDHCVMATAFDAIEAGFKVNVLTQLSAGITEESVAEALNGMRNAGCHII